ncbi:MAG TPA: glycogen debranching N-terminal domain-containing protein [Pseudonocardiaceae bacterium]|nr:glycogen debranching N-terminal domain-containing protein [Pseudonocardiaceae bacterium]
MLAPTAVASDHTGQLLGSRGHGVLHADVRVLSRAELVVDGSELELIRAVRDGSARSRFVSLARSLGDPGPDPTVRVERHRETTVDGVVERIHLVSTARTPVRTTVRLLLAADLVDVAAVKAGRDGDPVPFAAAGAGLTWGRDGITATATGEGAVAVATEAGGRLEWRVDLPPRGTEVLRWRLVATDPAAVVTAPVSAVEWERPEVTADDRRLTALLDQALDDLAALRLVTTDQPDQPFLAAGAPWFFTLFGRDSLWAARLLLPLGTELAGSTLRALAGRQGKSTDQRTAAAPGKIMHELRRNGFTEPTTGVTLPAVYYGTIDATPLWVCLLHDAWRWGLPAEDVDDLLPNLEAALGWLAGDADPDHDGFLEYVNETGSGLANQGWKDSGDSIRFRDGRLADPPIALCEVQGYAHEAAIKGAALLDAFGRTGADQWLDYADRLATRFRDRFWVADEHGPYPAIALDRDKRPVDAPTSNIGHLVGSGMLTTAEIDTIARRLAAPDMSSGYGLRTMSSEAGGYAPLSYHCGSVWPHDTVIVAQALGEAGQHAAATELVGGLLRAAPSFGYRLPELFGGDAVTDLPQPTPYPAACHPQAWAAAAAVGILRVLTGVRPDMPNRTVTVAPPAGSPVGALSVRGLRLGRGRLDLAVDAAGHPVSVRAPMGVTVTGRGRSGMDVRA